MTIPITRQNLEQAAILFAVGAAVFVVLALRARRAGGEPRRPLISAGALGALAALALGIGYSPLVPNIPTPFVPITARFQTNPVPDTPEVWAKGRETFQTRCAICHGARALGDGPAALAMNPRPFNLQLHSPLHAPGEVAYWIGEGVPGTGMPAWKEQLSETQIWEVVRYIYALADKRTAN